MRTDLKDFLLGLGVAALFAIVEFIVIPVEISVPRTLPIAANSPSFWPRVICGGMIVVGLALAFNAVMRLRAVGADAAVRPDAEVDEPTYPPGQALLRIGLAMAILVGYYVIVRWVGIVVASIVALGLLSSLYGEKRWWLIAILAISMPIVLYLFFTKIAEVSLPLGWLGS